jgi:2-keto-4-pentenoate hydratase
MRHGNRSGRPSVYQFLAICVVMHWHALDLKAHEVALIVNGETKLTGTGAAVLKHPLNSLTWLANILGEQGEALKAGEFISTGVCTDVYLAEPDDEIIADFGVIGRVAVSFMNT